MLSMQCPSKRKTPLLSPLGEKEELKPRKHKNKRLVVTDFSEADQKAFWSNVKTGKADECWEWQGVIKNNGYGSFPFRRKLFVASRVALVLSGVFLRTKLMALHSCDNRACCNPNHLRPGTCWDNTQDASSRNRLRGYEGKGRKREKLTASIVREVREKYYKGVPITHLAKKFNVIPYTISKAIHKRSWRNIT